MGLNPGFTIYLLHDLSELLHLCGSSVSLERAINELIHVKCSQQHEASSDCSVNFHMTVTLKFQS